MALIKFENEDKLFIKFFLLDASVNLNTWGVTRQAMLRGLKTFIGKPFVLTPDYGHPTAASGDDLLVQQEKFRVGDIIDVGIDTKSDKAYGIAEITNSQAKDILKNGDVNFVSPSIVFNNGAEVADKDGNSIITEFEGAHVAGVAEPAYGIDKAEIKGKCIGSKESCNLTLEKVEASVSECGNYLKIKRTKSAGRKKKEADDIDITMPRKRKDPVKTNTDKTLGNAKKTQKELDEDYEVQMQSFKKNNEEKDSVTEEEYKKYTSNKGKKGKENNNMKKSQEEKKKDEADETPEEDKVERGESLEEQYKDKEETDILKSEEEKDEEDAEKDEEAEDENKLDLTDKQEEYLKDKKESRLAKQVRVLKAELRAVKAKIRSAEIDPIIQSILDAKKSVGKIDAKSEYAKLSKLDIGTLRELEAHYDTIKEAKTQPRYVVRNASLNSSDKTGDNILLSMRGDF